MMLYTMIAIAVAATVRRAASETLLLGRTANARPTNRGAEQTDTSSANGKAWLTVSRDLAMRAETPSHMLNETAVPMRSAAACIAANVPRPVGPRKREVMSTIRVPDAATTIRDSTTKERRPWARREMLADGLCAMVRIGKLGFSGCIMLLDVHGKVI
jgi:hypothetical protein